MHKPRFTQQMWYWTLAHESLFDLTPEELELFEGFVREALQEPHNARP